MDFLRRFISDESSRGKEDENRQNEEEDVLDSVPDEVLVDDVQGEKVVEKPEVPKDKHDLYFEKLATKPIVPRGTRGKLNNKKMAAVLTAAVGLHAAGIEEVVSEGKYAKIAAEGVKTAAKKAYDLGVEAAHLPGETWEKIKSVEQDAEAWLRNRSEIKKRVLDNIRFSGDSGEISDKELGIKNLVVGKNEKGETEILPDQAHKVDWAKFYFKDEVLRGNMPKETADKKYANHRKKVEDWKKRAKAGEDPLRILHDIAQGQGSYDPNQPFVSGIILSEEEEKKGIKKKANCNGRDKYFLATVPEVFPDFKFKDQLSMEKKKDGSLEPHVRQVLKIENTWYSLEGTPFPLQPEKIDGTVFIDPVNALNDYFGFKKSARLTTLNQEKLSGHVDSGPSDGFNKLPPGVIPTRSAYGEGTIMNNPDKEIPFVKTSFEEAQNAMKVAVEKDKEEIERKRKLEHPDEAADLKAEIEKLKKQNGDQTVGGADWESPDVEYVFDSDKKEEEKSELKLSPQQIVEAKVNGVLSFAPVVQGKMKEIESGNIKPYVLDFSDVAEVPLDSVYLAGVEIDFSQLKGIENVTTMEIFYCNMKNIDGLKKVKYFDRLRIDSPQFGVPSYYPGGIQAYIQKQKQRLSEEGYRRSRLGERIERMQTEYSVEAYNELSKVIVPRLKAKVERPGLSENVVELHYPNSFINDFSFNDYFQSK